MVSGELVCPEETPPNGQIAGGQTHRADKQNPISNGMKYPCIQTHRTRIYEHEHFEIHFN